MGKKKRGRTLLRPLFQQHFKFCVELLRSTENSLQHFLSPGMSPVMVTADKGGFRAF